MSIVSVADLTKSITGFETAVKGTADALSVIRNLPTNDSLFLLVKEVLRPLFPGIMQSIAGLIDQVIELLEKIRLQLLPLQELHRSGVLFIRFHAQLLNCIAEAGNAMKKMGDALSVTDTVPGLSEFSFSAQSFYTLADNFFKVTDTEGICAKIPGLKNDLGIIRDEIKSLVL